MEQPKFKAYVRSEKEIYDVGQINWNKSGIKEIRIIGRYVPEWAKKRGLKSYVPTDLVKPDNFILLAFTGKYDELGDPIFNGDVLSLGLRLVAVDWDSELIQWVCSDGSLLFAIGSCIVVSNKYKEGIDG